MSNSWMNIKAKEEEAQKLITRAGSLLETAKKLEKREMTPEENASFDSDHIEAQKILDEVDVMKRQRNAEKTMEERIGREEIEVQKPASENKVNHFERYLRTGERSSEMRALSSGTSTEGAEFVPEDFYSKYEVYLRDLESVIEAGADVIKTSNGRPIPIPAINHTGNSSALFAENAAITDDGGNDPATSEIILNSYTVGSEVVKLSVQLVRDSGYPIEDALALCLAEANADSINSYLTTGTGTNQPKGVVTCATGSTAAASTTAVTYNEILELIHSLPRQYRKDGKLMFSDATFLAIKKLTDGNGNPLWNAGNVAAGVSGTFDGYPYVVNDKMADMSASAVAMLFANFKRGYTVRKVGKSEFHRFEDSNYMKSLQVGFMMVDFIDGDSPNTNCIKKLTMAAS